MDSDEIKKFLESSNYRSLKNYRNRLKEMMVEYKGGKCEKCGYNNCIDALEFHHINPSEKDFGISQYANLCYEDVKKEVDKCILVCANCHREIHHEENLKKQETESLKEIEIYKEILENRDIYGDIRVKKSYYFLEFTDVLKDINNGVDRKDILKKYHINNRTFSKFLKEHNIKYTKQKRVENRPTKKELEELLKKLSKSAIGRLYGVSCGSVIKWCKKYGI